MSSRIISILLILAMLTNDLIGSGMLLVSAASLEEAEQDVLTETDEAAEEEGEIPEDALPEEILQETEPEEILVEESTSEPEIGALEEEVDFLAEDEPQTVLIMEEDISKRSSNVKYFRNEDHSYTAAIYPDPVHFEENGQWKAINNQLADGDDEEGTQFLENTANLFKVKFAKRSNGSKLVKVKLQDAWISWDLKDADKVDAMEADHASGRSPGAFQVHTEEPLETKEGEKPATIFTESPAAAASGETDAVKAEALYGNQLRGTLEYNTSDGILPTEQEPYQDTDGEGEETLDDPYYRKIQDANEEAMKVRDLSSGVVYPEIFPGVDVEYLLDSQRLKDVNDILILYFFGV